MAQIIPCDGPHGEPVPAVFLISMITEAETVGLCAGCGCDWAQALLGELAPERLAPPPAKAPRKPRTTKAAAPAAASSAAPDGSSENA
jgi:hypothetical protein